MDKIFEKTRELGQALLESGVYQTMKAAEDKAMANEEAAQLMSEYIELHKQIQDLLSKPDPDPAVLKSLSDEMDGKQEKLNMIDDIDALTTARNNFNNAIAQVNKVLQFIVTGQMSDDEGGCTGSCASCGGGCGAH